MQVKEEGHSPAPLTLPPRDPLMHIVPVGTVNEVNLKSTRILQQHSLDFYQVQNAEPI